MSAVVEVKSLSKWFGEVIALNNLDLSRLSVITCDPASIGKLSAVSLEGEAVNLLTRLLVLLFGCDQESPTFQIREPALQVRTVNGQAVPVFPTADEQMAYTRSSFARLEEKRAALEAVALFFPDAAVQRGEAGLELAYLHLGTDYRQASAEAARQALSAYEQLLDTHGDFPAIAAKARWYQGWICCTLLAERERGLTAFRTLVEQFPQVERTTGPGAPMVSLTAPSERDVPLVGSEEQIFWADLALLAITRCAAEDETVRSALQQLWRRDPRGRCTGLALRDLLRRTPPSVEAVARARGGDAAELTRAAKEVVEGRVAARVKEMREEILRMIQLWQRDVLACAAGAEAGSGHFPEEAAAIAAQAAGLTFAEASARVAAVDEVRELLEHNIRDAAALPRLARALSRPVRA